jgi:hypothetical protein
LDKLNVAKSLISGILWLDQPPLNLVTMKPCEKVFEFWCNDKALYAFPKIEILQAIAGKLRFYP